VKGCRYSGIDGRYALEALVVLVQRRMTGVRRLLPDAPDQSDRSGTEARPLAGGRASLKQVASGPGELTAPRRRLCRILVVAIARNVQLRDKGPHTFRVASALYALCAAGRAMQKYSTKNALQKRRLDNLLLIEGSRTHHLSSYEFGGCAPPTPFVVSVKHVSRWGLFTRRSQ